MEGTEPWQGMDDEASLVNILLSVLPFHSCCMVPMYCSSKSENHATTWDSAQNGGKTIALEPAIQAYLIPQHLAKRFGPRSPAQDPWNAWIQSQVTRSFLRRFHEMCRGWSAWAARVVGNPETQLEHRSLRTPRSHRRCWETWPGAAAWP